MRLVDLQPKWLHPNLFVFLCPHCRQEWLSCKDVAMFAKDQGRLFEAEFGEDYHLKVVASKPDYAWTFTTRDFETMSVSPSIDASPSGHWHGHITGGEIAA